LKVPCVKEEKEGKNHHHHRKTAGSAPVVREREKRKKTAPDRASPRPGKKEGKKSSGERGHRPCFADQLEITR